MPDADVVIIGSGAAGVSAAVPLIESGLSVLMIDGGIEPEREIPDSSLYDIRTNAGEQWKMFVGERFQALRTDVPSSPKFRAPTNAYVFDRYGELYRARTSGFSLVGSLAAGGLTNAWGAAVSCYSREDLADYPVSLADLEPSYRSVARRIGVSGSDSDDLAPVLGTDIPLQPPTVLDENAARLFARYTRNPGPARRHGVTIGRPHHAVLTEDRHNRQACNQATTCIWGCARRAIYSARHDLETLKQRDRFHYRGHMFVEALIPHETGATLRIRPLDGSSPFEHRAAVIILACGTIGSGKLVLEALDLFDHNAHFLSSPTVGFALWLPDRIGAAVSKEAFGLTQLSYTVSAGDDGLAFGNLFGTDGLLMSEFMRYLPATRPSAIRLMKLLGPSLLLGNCFMPGRFSDHSLSVHADGSLHIRGGYREELSHFVHEVQRRLARMFIRYGLLVLPGSFTLTSPGEDVHYAATVPMSGTPEPGKSSPTGEVYGLPGVYVADGAALSALPAKEHTFTIMANADRIARGLAGRLEST